MKTQVEIEAGGFKGQLEVTVPLHFERMTALSEARIGELYTGDAEENDTERNKKMISQNIPIMASLYKKHVRSLIVGVSLANESGEKISSLEEFESHPDMTGGWLAITTEFIKGFGPGKK